VRNQVQSPDRPAPILLFSPYRNDRLEFPEILNHPHWQRVELLEASAREHGFVETGGTCDAPPSGAGCRCITKLPAR
jgi:hypothetical protein